MAGLLSNTLLGGLQPPLKRRVFFSFHYQQDIWRANQVRNSWRFPSERQREAEGFFDGSLWESAKRKSDESLKSLIRAGMQNTSVTCVLVGASTWTRRWVRYEIARSVVKGNGLLAVGVHHLRNQQGVASTEGANPLSAMGLYRIDDGRILFAEWLDGKWVRYRDYTSAVTLPPTWRKPDNADVVQLTNYARVYCYTQDDGRQNFSSWVSEAAKSVGR